MAPSCFALQVPDVRGLQPPCASFLLEVTKSRVGPGNEAIGTTERIATAYN